MAGLINELMNYHDVMEAYKRPPSIRFIPRIFGWLTVFILLFGVSKTAYAYDSEPVIWVQVPQWTDDWAVCAVDIPDAACHWYVANADNTFGEGFDWETGSPWFDANGLNDVAPISKQTVAQKLQEVGMSIQHIIPMFLEITAGTAILTTLFVVMMSSVMED